MREMETAEQVLSYTKCIQEVLNGETWKLSLNLDDDFESYEKLMTISFKIAVKKAHTVEEIEKCAVAVEECRYGQFDPDEWAEQIRIKAYGIEWYLKRQFNSPMFQEFVNFTNETGIDNPFEGLQEKLS